MRKVLVMLAIMVGIGIGGANLPGSGTSPVRGCYEDEGRFTEGGRCVALDNLTPRALDAITISWECETMGNKECGR